MIVLIKILQLLLSLSILVIVHEFGHFLMAKLFKTRIEKFYLFFDPWFSLFKFRKGETEYGIGWLPLGGYVKISGMIDESMDREAMKQPPQPYEFRSKKSWERLLIMTGGVVFNFILAVLIYVAVLFTWGKTYLPTSSVKYGIVTDSTGHSIGLKNGDKILSVDNQSVEVFNEIVQDILLNSRKSIQVERNGEKLDIPIPGDYITNLLKGRGLIDVRTPFSPMIIAFPKIESNAKKAGVLEGDELIGIDSLQFSFYDEFQKYVRENRTKTMVLHIVRKSNDQVLDIPVMPDEKGLLKRNPLAMILFHILSEFAYVEKEVLIERINSGLDEARRNGKKLGRKSGSTENRNDYLRKYSKLIPDIKAGISLKKCMKIHAVSKNTVIKIKKMLAA